MKTIKETFVVAIAKRAARDIYISLISTTDVPKIDALEIAQDSANELARIMTMMLSERDYAVVPTKAA